jgi:hypothetical protein
MEKGGSGAFKWCYMDKKGEGDMICRVQRRYGRMWRERRWKRCKCVRIGNVKCGVLRRKGVPWSTRRWEKGRIRGG